MGHYLVNFTAYTLAMIGVIFLCLVVYKKCFYDVAKQTTEQFLKVENSINLSPRKTIYVIKAGEEKFLIASDTDRTSFLAKLEEEATLSSAMSKRVEAEPKKVLDGVSISKELYKDDSQKVTKLPVMKELVRKLNAQRG